MPVVIDPKEGGGPVVALSDFRPSRRNDGLPWVRARIEVGDSPDTSTWAEADRETTSFEPADTDPTSPALRSFSVKTAKAWARVVFLDEDGGEDVPSALVYLLGPQFRPTLAQVSAILRARTYAAGEEGELTGGDLVGEFTAETRPTAAEVEDSYIPQACVDVLRATGPVPGELLEEARRIAALRAASEIERSYIPEQAEETRTIFQTLRLSFQEELEALNRNLWMWTLANRGVA